MEQKPSLPPIGNRGSGPLAQPSGATADVDLVKWVKEQPNLAAHGNKALVEKAELLAKQLVNAGMNTTQIRKILARINGLSARLQAQQEFDAGEVPLLKVQLVYAAAREKAKVGPLADVLLPAIDLIKDEADFRWFARFVEAIVAYHRFHGGKE